MLLLIIFIASINCQCELHKKTYSCGTLLRSWEGIHILCVNNDWHFYHTGNENLSTDCVEYSGTWARGEKVYEEGKIISDNLSPDGCYYKDLSQLCNTSDPICYSNVMKNKPSCSPIYTNEKTDNYWKYFSIICRNGRWIVDPNNIRDDSSKNPLPEKPKSSGLSFWEILLLGALAG